MHLNSRDDGGIGLYRSGESSSSQSSVTERRLGDIARCPDHIIAPTTGRQVKKLAATRRLMACICFNYATTINPMKVLAGTVKT